MTNKKDARNKQGLPLFSESGEEIHWVKTSVLSKLVNPFKGCWRDIDKPLTLEDVTAALQEEALEPPRSTSFQAALQMSDDEQTLARNRQAHARKVAWFVKNGFQQPLGIDVGVPSLRCHVQHIVQDGNHRLAAAIYRAKTLKEDPVLPLIIDGSVEHARKLGLWQHP
jgi:hypothetical protein